MYLFCNRGLSVRMFTSNFVAQIQLGPLPGDTKYSVQLYASPDYMTNCRPFESKQYNCHVNTSEFHIVSFNLQVI